MKTLRFAVLVRAPREAVWDAMLADATYRLWTAPFSEGSYFEGSWEAGAKIRFLGPGGQGITSEIAESRRPEVVSIRHLGLVKDGVDDTTSPEAAAWAPSYETYTFAEADGGTEVTATLDVPPDFEEYMTTTWPVASDSVKGSPWRSRQRGRWRVGSSASR